MIESSQKKKNMFYAIVLLLTLVAMIIGASLAYYRLVASQKEKSTVLYTGTLIVDYIDGRKIKDPELFPMKNVTYNTTKNVYRNNFQVESTGTLDQTIALSMIISENTFQNNALKYAIYNSNGERLNSGTVPGEGKTLMADNMFLAHGERATFTLIIWWDNTNYDQTSELQTPELCKVSGKISIYAKQVKY